MILYSSLYFLSSDYESCDQPGCLAEESNPYSEQFAIAFVVSIALSALALTCARAAPLIFSRRITSQEEDPLTEIIIPNSDEKMAEVEEESIIKEVTLPDGVIQRGVFKNGFLNGNGEVIYPSGKSEEGVYVNGLLNGEGEVKYANGGEYRGMFENGKPHGKGMKSLSNGITYEGTFLDGVFDGEFTITYSDPEKTQTKIFYSKGLKIGMETKIDKN